MREQEPRLIIGCIADDFTGASDIGSFFVRGGMNTLLTSGIPDGSLTIDPSVEAVVIALKNRSIAPDLAVAESLKALEYLQSAGCRQIYFKYCSTFDCTPKGNIGPIADALMRQTGSPYTLLCPSLPVNGRKVRDGGLYIHGIPLHESPMKDHPVNPMWDHRLGKIMESQSVYPCFIITADELAQEDLTPVIKSLREHQEGTPFYLIPDYAEAIHGRQIAEHFLDLPLITGGSGLAEHLARAHTTRQDPSPHQSAPLATGTEGRAVIFAGSCSTATTGQVGVFYEQGGTACELTAAGLLHDPSVRDDLIELVRDPETTDLLIHTDGNRGEGREKQAAGSSQRALSQLFETTMADLAEAALGAGITRIIIAGGETAGAITERLGYRSFLLGDSVAPGVPVLIPVENPSVRLVLKSGNFGQPDFFFKALQITSG